MRRGAHLSARAPDQVDIPLAYDNVVTASGPAYGAVTVPPAPPGPCGTRSGSRRAAPMRLSTVILPIHPWHAGGRERRRCAEGLG